MLFTSLVFMYFHLAVVALRWALPKPLVGPLLLVSSYVFYLSAGPWYAVLIGGATVAAWALGLALARSPRRALLTVGIVALLAVLGYYKYAAFLSAQAQALVGMLGLHVRLPSPRPELPLAISFFTFELISYLVDVYRGDVAERSLWRFALYVAYYPHLIAGPIVRASELLPSLRELPRFDGRQFSEGMNVMLLGYFKKTVLADNLAPAADAVFANPGAHPPHAVWLGVIAYSGQIYCDFSGYTDIARGASMTLGLPLPDNFDWPYLSTSITEFWRRWHMTLSRWLRDYLYISLGGNRQGTLAQYRNLFLTMLLGGLWHGASWNFVAWGALHGALLALHKLWMSRTSGIAGLTRLRTSLPWKALSLVTTFALVTLAWVPFRAPTFARSWEVIRACARWPAVFSPLPGAPWISASNSLGVLVIAHVLAANRVGEALHRSMPPIARGLYWAAIVVVCFLFAESRGSFIYFQF
jgi:alginate O-acetyltransferase complex protein AlgI